MKARLLNLLNFVAAIMASVYGGLFASYYVQLHGSFYNRLVISIISIGYWNVLLFLLLVWVFTQSKLRHSRDTINSLLDSMIVALKTGQNEWDLRSTIMIVKKARKKMIVQYYSSDFKTTPERNAVLPLDWGKSTKEP